MLIIALLRRQYVYIDIWQQDVDQCVCINDPNERFGVFSECRVLGKVFPFRSGGI